MVGDNVEVDRYLSLLLDPPVAMMNFQRTRLGIESSPGWLAGSLAGSWSEVRASARAVQVAVRVRVRVRMRESVRARKCCRS